MNSVLENIKRERKKKGYSQEYMAKKLNIAQNNYGKMERGLTQLTYEKIQKIADILEISSMKLLSESLKFLPNQPYIINGDNLISIESNEFNRLKEEIKFNASIGKGLIFIEYDTIDQKFITVYENLKEPLKKEYLDQIEHSWIIDNVIDTMEKDSKEPIKFKSENEKRKQEK